MKQQTYKVMSQLPKLRNKNTQCELFHTAVQSNWKWKRFIVITDGIKTCFNTSICWWQK